MGDLGRALILNSEIIIKDECSSDSFDNSLTNVMNNNSSPTAKPLSSASVPIPTTLARRFQQQEAHDYCGSGPATFDNSCSSLDAEDSINSSSLLLNHHNPTHLITSSSDGSTSTWDGGTSGGVKSEILLHMDDDDIFQVDKADLIQGPTLAELNANDEISTLGDLNFDDLLLPGEQQQQRHYVTFATTKQQSATPPSGLQQQQNTTTTTNSLHAHFSSNNLNNNNNNNNNTSGNTVMFATSCPPSGGGCVLYYRNFDSPLGGTTGTLSPTSSNSPQLQSSPTHSNNNNNNSSSTIQQKHSTLHELLVKGVGEGSPRREGPNVITILSNSNSFSPQQQQYSGGGGRLSSSAPTNLGLEQLWQRREPRKHLLSTGSMVEAESTSSLSTGGVLSPEPHEFSAEEFDSDDDDSDDVHYEDMSSDNDYSDEEHHPNRKSGVSKKERYFWQYNVQAKGPKGQRLVLKSRLEDPHVLNEVTDPVFSPDCSVRGIKHSGKARKGDGNDLTPNARKLYNIGRELDKLSRIINDMTPVSELPFNIRPKSRKEKNKLASRACRLKKKAQHEANKIKLSGLEVEHKQILNSIEKSKDLLLVKLQEQPLEVQEKISLHIEHICRNASKSKVAGQTTEYVNKILEKLRKGPGMIATNPILITSDNF